MPVEKIINDTLVKIAHKKIASADMNDFESKVLNNNAYQQRLERMVIEETKRLHRNGKLAYRRINGKLGIFDTLKVHEKFGFNSGDRIQTEWGPATVIGILKDDDKLWFHIDYKNGASFWSDANDFKLIKSTKKKRKKRKTVKRASNHDAPNAEEKETEEFQKEVHSLLEKIPPIPPIN